MSKQINPIWKKYLIIGSGILIIAIIIGEAIVLTTPQPLDMMIYKKAPDFNLVDQNNNNVTLNTYLGKVLMIDFIYTHCPNPNGTLGECSTETANMNNLLTILINKSFTSSEFHFISVSVDWKFDNVSTMYAYGMDRAEGRFQYWSFLSGNQAQITSIASNYSIVADYENTTINNSTVPLQSTQPSINNTIEYMSHTLMAYLIDKNGDIRMLKSSTGTIFPISGTTWIPSDVANQIITLINE